TQIRLDKLIQLEKLLDSALELTATRDEMAEKQAGGVGLDEDISSARKRTAELEGEVDLLNAQHRRAPYEGLARQAAGLEKRTQIAQDLDSVCADLAKDLKATKRPDKADVDRWQAFHNQIKRDQAKLQATGVRFELAATEGSRSLRIAEDGGPLKGVTL